MSNIKTIQIAFNLDDPFQEKLYNHIKQYKNTSFYGKSLIQRDMQNSWQSMREDFIEVTDLNVDYESFI